MRFSFVIISVLFFALSSAKKWSPDNNDEGLHKVHKGKHYVGDDEAHSVDGRKEEKEQYYKRKHFSQVDHKPLLKHSPIHITEEDAKLQLDLDKPERKHHRREPDLHIQHLNSVHKSNSKRFDENERKKITDSQLTNDKENKEHSEKNEKHHHHHNHNKNHDKEVKPNNNKEKKYNPKIYVEQVNKFDGLKHRGIDSDDKNVERKKERKPKNKSQEKKEAKDKKKRKYFYNKKKEGGKKYKVIVYGKY